jgi:hypothetical protein
MAGGHVVERVQSRTGRRRGQWAGYGAACFKAMALTACRPPGSLRLAISRRMAGGGHGSRLHFATETGCMRRAGSWPGGGLRHRGLSIAVIGTRVIAGPIVPSLVEARMAGRQRIREGLPSRGRSQAAFRGRHQHPPGFAAGPSPGPEIEARHWCDLLSHRPTGKRCEDLRFRGPYFVFRASVRRHPGRLIRGLLGRSDRSALCQSPASALGLAGHPRSNRGQTGGERRSRPYRAPGVRPGHPAQALGTQ